MKKHILIFLLLIILVTHSIALPRHPEPSVKALFVWRLCTDFIWPDTPDKLNTQKPFVIGVIGPNPFEKYLDDCFLERKVMNKKVIIKYTENVNDVLSCDAIYISQNFSGNVKTILSLIKNKPILAICDSKKIANYGVLIYLSKKQASTETESFLIEIDKKVYSESLVRVFPKYLEHPKVRLR